MTKHEQQSAPPGDLNQWQTLVAAEQAELVDAASQVDATDVTAVQKLRAAWPAELVRLALELAAARRKAAGKFGDGRAARMVCDVVGVEQASSLVVAMHKAQRFAAMQPGRIVDLCSGIGGDAMALAETAATLAVDRSDIRAWMTQCNAGCDVSAADVQTVDVTGAAVHVDPDRRSSGRRAWRFADYEPGPVFLAELADRASAVALKLGPGVAFDELPAVAGSEIELISEDGGLVQAVLWTGELAQNPGQRTATLLPGGAMFSGRPNGTIRTDTIGRYVFTIDPAIERAGLFGTFIDTIGAAAVHPRVGLVTTDEVLHSPWLRGYVVEAVMPWRETKVYRWLRAHGAGVVSVKTRGGIVNTDELQRKLRGDGDRLFTVFILRMDQKVFAIIGSRMAAE